MSEGLTAPRGAPVVYALVFETKSDPNGTFPLHLTLPAVTLNNSCCRQSAISPTHLRREE
ncbi:hypothetical protein DBO95_26340 [Yersinia pestis]|nr:hypothetical protein DBO95_26340 [Yersinia pestis]